MKKTFDTNTFVVAMVLCFWTQLALAQSYSHSQQDLYGGSQLDSRSTYNSTDSGDYLESQTHIEYPVSDDGNTSVFGGSQSVDYIGTSEGDNTDYVGGIKTEF